MTSLMSGSSARPSVLLWVVVQPPDPYHVAGCSLVIGNDASGPRRKAAHIENSWNCAEGEMSFGLCLDVARSVDLPVLGSVL